MSSLIVEICKVDGVTDAIGSDRLSNIRIKGWNVISSKLADGTPRYKVGNSLIYLPPDSLLDEKLLTYLFPEGEQGKIKPPSGGRLKAIKIRGNLSYGMSIDITPELEQIYPGISKKKVGDNVADLLNVKKWEPEESNNLLGEKANNHPSFRKFTDIENIKNYEAVFIPGEEITATIKLHGTSWRAGLFKDFNPSLWQKVKAFFTRKPSTVFCVGSRNCQLNPYSTNVYTRAVKQYNVKEILELGEEIFGELVGHGIQKNYNYGLNQGKIKLYLYDVAIDGRYLDRDEFITWCKERGFDSCPEVYRGPFDRELMEKLSGGKDHLLDSTIPCREGIVIKPVHERIDPQASRAVLKLINGEYLLKDTTDYH